MSRSTYLSVLLAAFLVLLAGCQEAPEQTSYSGPIFGTSYHVTVVSGGKSFPSDLQQKIEAELQLVDRLMSTYKPDSELNALSTMQIGETMQISTQLQQVLDISRDVYQLTDGSFDPTVGPLVDLWGFGPGKRLGITPPAKEIESILERVGFSALSWEGGVASKTKWVHLDLSAVAKGYAADLVSDKLVELGFASHLVEVGGELRIRGKKTDGSNWRIGIEKPLLGRSSSPQQVIELTDVGLATSGDYRNYFEQDGVRYSHTIDPRTGYPIRHNLASVTVLADSSGRADALATAFMVLGAEQTLELAEQQNIPVYLLVKESEGFVVKYSKAFKPYLR